MSIHLPGTRSLRTLEAACRHLNFSRAAAEIGLTPAAVSHQVKEFEDQLGVTLFHRTSRAATLTPAGEIMHTALREVLDVLMRASTNAQRTHQARRLHISTVETVASKWLLPRIGSFTRLHPDIDIALDISGDVRDFLRDNIDVAFRWGDGDYPGIDLVGRLGGEEFSVFLPGAHADQCAEIAERIRVAVQRSDFRPNGDRWLLSVSIGAAPFAAATTFSELYRVADQHLYDAKRKGRNRVAVAAPLDGTAAQRVH
jgi:DNA-binding transcriptional LysR family regulator